MQVRKKDKFYLSIIVIIVIFFSGIVFMTVKKDIKISRVINLILNNDNPINNYANYEKILNKKDKLISDLKKLKKYEYNQSFFPKTQFLELTFLEKKFQINLDKKEVSKIKEIKKKYNKKKNTPFFLEQFEDNLILSSRDGKIYNSSFKNILNQNKKLELNYISSNIKGNIIVTDMLMENNLLFIAIFDKENCKSIIFNGEFQKNNIQFKEFYSNKMHKRCNKFPTGGRLAKDDKYIYFSTDAYSFTNSTVNDEIFTNDHLGVIIKIDKLSKEIKLLSTGHRNVQGLIVHEDVVLATEHGPRGGDEINKILENNDYGWPSTSYGEPYTTKAFNNYKLNKNHKVNGFKEPIFSYVPSIGISQIIEVKPSFSEKWSGNFLITSLNGGILERITFDSNFNKVISKEKIKIGYRMRDILYNDKKNIFLLSLEDGDGRLGILKVKN
tara:strand:- start:732 stop:2054 length:1323 start_codon:yes stop_codon:yes gene_type:complete